MQVEVNYGGDTKLLKFRSDDFVTFKTSCDAKASSQFRDVILYEIPAASQIVEVIRESDLASTLLQKPPGCIYSGGI